MGVCPLRELQHHKQRHQSSAEWQRKRKKRQCLSPSLINSRSAHSCSRGSSDAARRSFHVDDACMEEMESHLQRACRPYRHLMAAGERQCLSHEGSGTHKAKAVS